MDFCRSKDDLKWKDPASEKRSLSQFCLIHVWEFCLFACLHQKTSPIENHHHSRHCLPKTAAVYILLFLLLGLPLFTNVPPTFPQPPWQPLCGWKVWWSVFCKERKELKLSPTTSLTLHRAWSLSWVPSNRLQPRRPRHEEAAQPPWKNNEVVLSFKLWSHLVSLLVVEVECHSFYPSVVCVTRVLCDNRIKIKNKFLTHSALCNMKLQLNSKNSCTSSFPFFVIADLRNSPESLCMVFLN